MLRYPTPGNDYGQINRSQVERIAVVFERTWCHEEMAGRIGVADIA